MATIAADLVACCDAPPVRRSSRSHAAIVAAVLDLAAEAGVTAVTIDGVAARAGVGKATIYRHWPTKAALLSEALTSVIPPLVDADTGDLREDLVHCYDALIEVCTTSPLARLLPSLLDAAERDPELGKVHADLVRSKRTVVHEVLARAQARGDVAADLDLELAVDLIAGPIFYRRLVTHEPITRAVTTRVIDALLPSLTRPSCADASHDRQPSANLGA